MNDKDKKLLTDVFQFYEDYIKPIYAEIQAEQNNLPSELLFEIHASFDHIKRYFIGNNKETMKEATEKVTSHLKRGVFDAFKLKLKFFNKELPLK